MWNLLASGVSFHISDADIRNGDIDNKLSISLQPHPHLVENEGNKKLFNNLVSVHDNNYYIFIFDSSKS